MVSLTTQPLGAETTATAARGAGRMRLRWFFPAVSGILLVVLVVGFAPSFFLRGHITTPLPLRTMPPYLVLHGVVLTAWFALTFAQTCLVASHRTDLHRRLGIVAVGVALLVVPVSALVVVRAVPRLLADGVPREFVAGLVAGDSLSLAYFSLLVVAAVYFRKRPHLHKRLMLMSGVMIFGPVLERYYFFYGLPRLTEVFPVFILSALGVYDLVVDRRLRLVTLLIFVGIPLFYGVIATGLMRSGAVNAFIEAVR